MPFSAAVCGLPPPLSFTCRVPLRMPVAIGLNLMPRVQLEPPASVSPHVLEVMGKSAGFSPATPMLVKVTVALLTLVTVMV